MESPKKGSPKISPRKRTTSSLLSFPPIHKPLKNEGNNSKSKLIFPSIQEENITNLQSYSSFDFVPKEDKIIQHSPEDVRFKEYEEKIKDLTDTIEEQKKIIDEYQSRPQISEQTIMESKAF